MKKVLILLLLLLVACGGTSEESSVQDTTTTTVQDTTTTTVEDTTTTTIPPAPTSDINYIELYNSKLGAELCSDAKEIDTTSEECLRQYKENLNYLITLQNEIGDFGSALIAYYETYPELVNQEYEDYINFIENEYSQVFLKFSNVENKYIERFGGVPIIKEITFDDNSKLSVGCEVGGKFLVGENMYKATLNYKNDIGQIYSFTINKNKLTFNLELLTQGGVFNFIGGEGQNYLGEIYELNNFSSSFFVNHLFNRVIDIILPSDVISVGDEFIIEIIFDPLNKVENAFINFKDITRGYSDRNLELSTDNIQGNKAIFSGTYVSSQEEVKYINRNGISLSETVYFYPNQKEYPIHSVMIPMFPNTREKTFLIDPFSNGGIYLPGECGPVDTLWLDDAFPWKEKFLTINP